MMVSLFENKLIGKVVIKKMKIKVGRVNEDLTGACNDKYSCSVPFSFFSMNKF